MRFDSEIVYRMPISLNEWYIRREYEALNIKEFYKKEVEKMDYEINKEAFNAYYADLLAKREEAVAVALADLDTKVNEAFELERERIAKETKEKLVAEAEAPYKPFIELCEKFIAQEKVEEEVAEETVEQVGGEY